MKYIVEKRLADFDFWSGAVHNAEKLTTAEMDRLEICLQDLYPDHPPKDVEINDLFWFDFDTVCDWLGLDPQDVENRE